MSKKILTTVLITALLSMTGGFLPISSALATARLTNAKDTISRNQASGTDTGTATSGYTESTVLVSEGFVFSDGDNDIICFDADDTASFDATCTGVGNVKVDIIDDGGLVDGSIYSGDEVAAAIKAGLEAQDGDADDVYTVTYDESTDKFTVRGDGGNTLDTSLGWNTYTGSDSAAATLGYTADDNNIRSAAAVSDTAVAFNVIASVNDTFNLSIDGKKSDNTAGFSAITVASGSYTATTLATQLDTDIDSVFTGAGGAPTADVSYSGSKFKITSNTTGENSTIDITEGANDFLKTIEMNGDTPIDGEDASGIVSANHTIQFTATTAVPADGQIIIDFPTGFVLPTDLNFEDFDMTVDGAERTLAAAQGAGVDGVTVITGDGGSITIDLATDTGIDAADVVIIEIGRHATYGVTGDEQIINPTSVGLYQILFETRDDSDVILDDVYVGVFIIPDDSVTIKGTVDPRLSMDIYGGTALDFGTFEPNAYHKLGGATNAYGSITLTGVTFDGGEDGETVTVRGIVYEFSDDGTIAAGSDAIVDIVDNENNYLTAAQVAENLYRAINNQDGDYIRANVDTGTDTVVNVLAKVPGTAGNAYTLAETVTDANFSVSGATFSGGVDGYNKKAADIDYNSATGSDMGNGHVGTNIVISTNAAQGYVIAVQNTDTGSDNGDGLTNGTTDIDAWTTGTYGYGILVAAQSARYGDATANIVVAAYQGDGTSDLPEAMSTTPTTFVSHSVPTAGDNIAIEYNVRIDPLQPAGQYTDTVTYTTTSTF